MSNPQIDASPTAAGALETTASQPAGELRGAPTAGRRRLANSAALIERLGFVAVLIATIIAFSIAAPQTFPTTANLQSILATQSVLAVVAIGAMIPLVVGQFDLSIGAIAGISSLAGAAFMHSVHLGLVLAVICAVLFGGFIGLINGLLVARLRVNSIITTLGSASVLAGIAELYSNGTTVATGISANLIDFGTDKVAGIPLLFVAVVVIALVVGYVLRLTPFGRTLFATGSNERAAVLVGLPVKRLTVASFVIAGLIAGLGGVMQLAQAGSADPSFGPNLLLSALTAVFLGATAVRPGEYNVLGTLLAIAFLAVSLSGLALIGAPAWVEPAYDGVALIVAVALSATMRARRAGTG